MNHSKQEVMGKGTIIVLVVGLALVLVHPTEAQQPAKVPAIGFLSTGSPWPNFEAFRLGLRDLGYIEEKNITIESRFAEEKFDRLSDLAAELVRLNVDILVAGNSTVARGAKKVTTIIPIVMANAGDPVGSGLVASLARPGGNVTGLTNYSPELLGKRLELLKEVAPKVSRVALLNDAASRADRSMFKDAQQASRILGVKLQSVEVKAPNPDLEGASELWSRSALALSSQPLARSSVFTERELWSYWNRTVCQRFTLSRNGWTVVV